MPDCLYTVELCWSLPTLMLLNVWVIKNPRDPCSPNVMMHNDVIMHNALYLHLGQNQQLRSIRHRQDSFQQSTLTHLAVRCVCVCS